MNKPKYSGANRSGTCICGHSWEDHHLGIVANKSYFEETGEGYFPEECEAFGFNETGGMKCINGKWVVHCERYRDTMNKEEE